MLELEDVKPSPTHVRAIAADLLPALVLVPHVFDVAHLAREVADETEALHHLRSRFSALPFVGDVRLAVDGAEIGQVGLKKVEHSDAVRRQEPADRAQRRHLALDRIEMVEGSKGHQNRAVLASQLQRGHVGADEADLPARVLEPFEA
jgi:hypothetical protein